ncbi:MAG: tetraacyldisaccharide 4'-kinase [Coprobacter sp.]|nr:tetraacyldisaccharide 4'-kinase [Coprobacter sp.]
MMESHPMKFNKALWPFAVVFKAIVQVRNWLFDHRILRSESFDIPVIAVGNITVGGTGKTPHTEYLIRLLSNHYRVAFLSRGYKRKSKNFVVVQVSSTASEAGDEPLQIKRKFNHIVVAVDGNRRRGIAEIRRRFPEVNLIVLDDAFQHRYVSPSTSILLTDFHRLIYEDRMLPVGRLREPVSGKARADIVIVTKCPNNIKPIGYRIITKHLQLFPYQRLYFSTFRYDRVLPVFPDQCIVPTDEPTDIGLYENVIAVSGIASPESFIHYVTHHCPSARCVTFGDHHYFTAKDIARIQRMAEQERPENTLVIVTEKDAARLIHNHRVDNSLRKVLVYLPLRVSFLLNQGREFDAQILEAAQRSGQQP